MDLRAFIVKPESHIREVIARIDANRRGVAILVDKESHFSGVITDGDIRRAILAGLDLHLPASTLIERRKQEMYPRPISAPVGTSSQEIIKIMRQHKIRHLPLLDELGKVVDLVFLEDFIDVPAERITAVVMAGGFGKRLHPLTNELPKPMLPMDGKPLMERQIEQLQTSGIQKVYVTTHYKSEKIIEHFGNGEGFGVEINYIQESQPLGTAGALALLPKSTKPLLVINGDILTRVDFSTLFNFHKDQGAEMTVAVREFKSHVPYGVVEVKGIDVIEVVEKPTKRCFINAGIYVLNPSALQLIPFNGENFDMPDLINLLVNQGQRVVSFPIREYWVDIGHMEDYERALKDLANGRL